MMRTTILLLLIVLFSLSVYSKDLYVDSAHGACDDSYNWAANAEVTPWCNLTSINGNIQDGDTVYVKEGLGIYNQRFYFTDHEFTSTTTIRNYPGDTPVLRHFSGEHAAEGNGLWTNRSNSTHNRWVTPISISSYLIMEHKGEWWFNFNSMANWNTSRQINAVFADDPDNLLYAQFTDLSFNPNNEVIYLSDSDYGLVRFEDVNGPVVFEGFNVSGSRYNFYGINVSDITIRNNVFGIGTRSIYPVRTGSGDELYNISIYNNSVLGFYDFNNWYWMDIKDDNKDIGMESTGIEVKNAISEVNVYDNYVSNWFNGIFVEPETIRVTNARVYNNEIVNTADDGIEFEYLFAGNNSIDNNNISGSYNGISVAYGDCEGDCWIKYNAIHNTRATTWDATSDPKYGECIKWGQSGQVNRNWTIWQNTCYSKRFGVVGVADGSNNVTWLDNLIVINGTTDEIFSRTGIANKSVHIDYNLVYSFGLGLYAQYYNDESDATGYPTPAHAIAGPNNPGTWDLNTVWADPLLGDGEGGNLTPMADSPACSMSSTGGYVGAFPCAADSAPEEETAPAYEIPQFNLGAEGMDLITFSILFSVSVLLIILDIVLKKKDAGVLSDMPALGIAGYSLLFILGASVAVAGLYYETGTFESTIYGYGVDNGTVNIDYVNWTYTNLSVQYVEIPNLAGPVDLSHLIGFLLGSIGLIGFVWCYMDIKGLRNDEI